MNCHVCDDTKVCDGTVCSACYDADVDLKIMATESAAYEQIRLGMVDADGSDAYFIYAATIAIGICERYKEIINNVQQAEQQW